MARAAAKDRNAMVVGGANLVRQLFAANLVDELHVDVMPVLSAPALSSGAAQVSSTCVSRRSACRAPASGRLSSTE